MTTETTCRRCGAVVAPGAEFCPLCGLAITADTKLGVTDPAVAPAAAPGPAAGSPSGSMRSVLDDQALAALRDATLGEYEILSELGRGGMATVFLAHEIALNRKVAIKLISPHLLADNTAERFLREARTAAGLSHPNLIPIFSVRETDSLLFFVMKYVAGPSLEGVLKGGEKLSIPIIQAILSETASALGYAHRRQIVHRDVKPGNIMIDEDGRVVVTDFGIARDTQSTGLTGTGMAVGTPMYMSPEQCIGDPVSGASDQYSLGILGYELLTGKVPFEAANSIAMMYAHIHTAPTPITDLRPDCPPPLAAAIMRMIEKAAANRWPTIDEAIKAIGAPPLTADDPVRQTLMELARVGAAARQISIPSTPKSPMNTRNIPRGPARPLGTPARGVVANNAATVRITPLEQTPAAEGASAPPPVRARSAWRVPLVVAAVVIIGVLVWRGLASRVAAPPESTAGSATATAVPTAPPPAAPAPDKPLGSTPTLPQPGTNPLAAMAPATQGTRRATTVAISPPLSELKVGESIQLHALVRDSAGKAIADRPTRWTSSDPRVATVSRTGLLAGVADGRVDVTATVDGSSASASVAVAHPTVAPPAAVPVASVDLTPSALAVNVGATGQLTATVRDAAGSALADRGVQWSSSNSQVADVSTSGRVLGLAAGAAQITATAEGRSGTATVTVSAPVAAAPPPPAPPPDPTPAIRKLLEDYVAAISGRNVARISKLYPGLTVSERATWNKLFDDFSDVSATLVPASVKIDVSQAAWAASFDLTVVLAKARERSKGLMHVEADLEQDNGVWRFMSIKQSFLNE